ncbi:hypothetical protein EIB96_15055 [Vibrio parahaemolyticus]|nr:hypothetical protein [Vibrio parahaemolyticus]RFD42930.1 hypothetical protein H328_003495 [Vibrio parahaemolyticus 3355]EGR0988187.1 hypothetical protein [Vibrio parahaemolyticus]EGR1372046.1 hypothetical protein [Vibrio parahaemolyticus]EGR1948085.1 hypothetical protein [Vibrio parahaemolyticus]
MRLLKNVLHRYSTDTAQLRMQVIEQINDEKLRHQIEQQERERAREATLQQETILRTNVGQICW